MTHEELLKKAKEKAENNFNELPFELRKKLANPLDRWLELNLILSKGERLSMAYLKKRKRELEDWMIKWYMEDRQD